MWDSVWVVIAALASAMALLAAASSQRDSSLARSCCLRMLALPGAAEVVPNARVSRAAWRTERCVSRSWRLTAAIRARLPGALGGIHGLIESMGRFFLEAGGGRVVGGLVGGGRLVHLGLLTESLIHLAFNDYRHEAITKRGKERH